MQIEQPYELVLFGGLGDLALRKLFPALYLLELDAVSYTHLTLPTNREV